MFYTPLYRNAEYLLESAGYHSCERDRGYEKVAKQLQAEKVPGIVKIDRMHAIVAHGFINIHADTTVESDIHRNGKKHISKAGSTCVYHELQIIKGFDTPVSKIEKWKKDFRLFVETQSYKYPMLRRLVL